MEVNASNRKYYKAAMMVLLTIEASFLFIQAAKSFKTQSVNDLDLTAFIILLVTNIAWLFYGYAVVYDFPLMLSGGLYSVGAILVIVAILLYRTDDSLKDISSLKKA